MILNEKPVNHQCDILVQHILRDSGNLQDNKFWNELGSDYQKKVTSLIRQFEDDSHTPALTGKFSDWVQIADFLVVVKSRVLKSASYRAVKSPITKILNYGLKNQFLDDDLLRSALLKLKESKGVPANIKSKSTSGKKARSLKPDDIYILRSYARTNPNYKFAVSWLEFNVLTNCRPNELESATLVLPSHSNTEPFLKVKNTIKNNRTKEAIESGAQDEFRHIPLDNCSFHDLVFIDNFLSSYRERRTLSDYQDIYNTERNLLGTASIKAVGRRFSLSLGRTQWAANAKATDKSKTEISASMGHSNEEQATRNYGKKVHGWQRVPSRSGSKTDSQHSPSQTDSKMMQMGEDQVLDIDIDDEMVK